jgi:hypothetical protein
MEEGGSGSCRLVPTFYWQCKKHQLAYFTDGIKPQNNDSGFGQSFKIWKAEKAWIMQFIYSSKCEVFHVPFAQSALFIQELASYDKNVIWLYKVCSFYYFKFDKVKESVTHLMENNGKCDKE